MVATARWHGTLWTAEWTDKPRRPQRSWTPLVRLSAPVRLCLTGLTWPTKLTLAALATGRRPGADGLPPAVRQKAWTSVYPVRRSSTSTTVDNSPGAQHTSRLLPPFASWLQSYPETRSCPSHFHCNPVQTAAGQSKGASSSSSTTHRRLDART